MIDDVQKYIGVCRRYVMSNRIIRGVCIAVCIIAFWGGMAGIICCVANNNYRYFSLFASISLAVPIVILVGYFIWLATGSSKRQEKFRKMLYDSNLSAEEVLQIGKAVGMDLFAIALDIRCKKELKLPGVPQWCARDGVLPDSIKDKEF